MTAISNTKASIYTAGSWIWGTVHEEGGRVTAIEGVPLVEPRAPYLVPAFVDLHVHGGGGYEVMLGGEETRGVARFHARHGTGAFCPTTLTAPLDQITSAIEAAAAVMERPMADESEVLGVHIEGPFINPAKLGGQPAFAITPDLGITRHWLDIADIKIMTLAPELDGARELIELLSASGVRSQVGHSLADDETLASAEAWGASGYAHLFNAAAPVTARSPGVIGRALNHAHWAELICDLRHVHPSLLTHAIKTIPGAYSITDCCAAGGLPDGDYALGLNAVTKADGVVYLRGTRQIAASVLTADEAFRNIVSLGVGLETAIWMTSARPAQYVGARDYGELSQGKFASAVLLDGDLMVAQVWLKGIEVLLA